MTQLCINCNKEYEAQFETRIEQRFGETREIEVEITEGLCDGCREDKPDDIF